MSNTMDQDQWLRWEEEVAKLAHTHKNVWDIGVGAGLLEDSEMQAWEITDFMYGLQPSDGAHHIRINLANGRAVDAYIRVRGRHIDVGSRSDFEELGWGAICEYMDRQEAGSD